MRLMTRNTEITFIERISTKFFRQIYFFEISNLRENWISFENNLSNNFFLFISWKCALFDLPVMPLRVRQVLTVRIAKR